MPIEIQCAHCKRKLRVAEKFAGKRAKCPGCQEPIDIPAISEEVSEDAASGAAKSSPAQSTPSAKAAKEEKSTPSQPVASKPVASKSAPKTPAKAEVDKEEWYMKTDDGEEYGPVKKAEMDAWVEDGRVDGTCQLLREGWEQWKWAEEVYPQLGDETASEESAAEEEEPAAASPAEDAGLGFDLEALTGGGGESSAAAAVDDDDPLAGIGYDAAPTFTSKTSAKTSSKAAKSSSPAKSSRGKKAKPQPVEETEPEEEETGVGLSTRGKKALAGTQPWVKFFAILLFLGAGLMGLGGIGISVLALGLFTVSAALGAVFLIGALVYFAAAGGYGYAGYCLFKYGAQIKKYLGHGKTSDLDAALVAQQAFWKFVGIISAVVMGISLVLPIVMKLLGQAMMAGGPPAGM